MSWSHKYELSDGSYYKLAEKDGYILKVEFISQCNLYRFCVEKNLYSYDSLNDNKTYLTEEDCMNACEKFARIRCLKCEIWKRLRKTHGYAISKLD